MARAPSPARKARARSRGKEKPSHLNQVAGFWRRPTLARPIAVLPSGLQRFTAVFGMGTGGATALLSPEPRSACAARLWCVIQIRYIGFADSRLSFHDKLQRTPVRWHLHTGVREMLSAFAKATA